MTAIPYTQTHWSLNDLFPGVESPEMKATIDSLVVQVGAFEAIRAQLADGIANDAFLTIIRQYEQMAILEHKLYAYAELSFAQNTQDQAAQSLMARVDQFFAELGNRVLFFGLWWKDMPDEAANRLIGISGDYGYWLEEMRHFKPHTLSEAEEKIVNIKNVTGINALNMLYDSITNRYTFKLKVADEVKELTRGELMVYVRGSNADLRARAYQELYRVYGADGPILGQVYQTVARDWRNEQVALRKFASPIAARNLVNDIPDEVIDTLLEVCQRNVGIFQRYFQLKARWVGMERLRRYDIYAPVARAEKQYAFGEAADMVFSSFRKFDPAFAEKAERVFAQNHLDGEVRRGKRGGAFCLTALPNLTPWVQLNYQGHAEDVATMAHELGHAIHSMLASQHSVFTAHACLPLAETASTFAEMMLVDELLKNEPDEAVRRDLLFRQVDDSYATIQRQAYFALFERQAHQMISEDASVDELAAAYLENLHAQFGDSVEIADEFRWEWVSIPHIFNVPFYVYAYTFGQLLVLSLYKQFKAEGESFKPRYIRLLSTGGSKAPMQNLSEAGIDAHQASFWQGGFDVIEGLVKELEAIPVK